MRRWALLLAAAALAACASGEARRRPQSPPLRVAEPDPVGPFAPEPDPVRLFLQLDRQLRNFRDPRIDPRARHQLRRILRRTVDVNYPALREAVLKGDEARRLVAAWALAFAGDPGATALLVALLADPSPAVRANALFALGERGDPATPLEPILEALNHRHPGVRCNAARAVSRLVHPRTARARAALAALTSLVHDREPKVRLAAVGALGALGETAAAGFLLDALRDEYPLIRARAALGLARLGHRPAVPTLIALLRTERNATAARCYVRALRTLTGQKHTTFDEWRAWWRRRGGDR